MMKFVCCSVVLLVVCSCGSDRRTTGADSGGPGVDAGRSDAGGTDGARVDSMGLDGAPVGLDGAMDTAVPPGALRVFLTSSQSGGNLGGLIGADARCQADADGAGLGGTFVAWISDASTPAIERLTGAGPWFSTDGSRVFADLEAVADPFTDLETSLFYDESGNFLATERIWTGTNSDGQYATSIGDNCQQWTSDAMGDQARVGQVGRVGGEWTSAFFTTCDQTGTRLICFEQ